MTPCAAASTPGQQQSETPRGQFALNFLVSVGVALSFGCAIMEAGSDVRTSCSLLGLSVLACSFLPFSPASPVFLADMMLFFTVLELGASERKRGLHPVGKSSEGFGAISRTEPRHGNPHCSHTSISGFVLRFVQGHPFNRVRIAIARIHAAESQSRIDVSVARRRPPYLSSL